MAASRNAAAKAVANATSSASALPPHRQLASLRARVFGETFNPTSERTGAKYLRQRLVGPAMLTYYPPQLKLRGLLNSVAHLPGPDGKPFGKTNDVLVAPHEAQRLIDVERRKFMGKGPPKKGE